MIILIIGLSGAGKTALTKELAPKINATVLNGDEIRSGLNSDLSFREEDRIENARRIGEIARLLSKQGHTVIADFICPNSKTRNAFGKYDYMIWVNRINKCKYEDTNNIWENPTADLVITDGMTPEEEANYVISYFDFYDWSAPTALMLGRYQPWHDGHQSLMNAALVGSNQIAIGVRNTYKTSEKDPLNFDEVKNYITQKVKNPFIIKMPNITRIVYGRDVGYSIEKIEMEPEIEAISATKIRKQLGI